MLPSPPNHPFIVEATKIGVAGNKFYYAPKDAALLATFNRYKAINCNCPAYARERTTLLAEIQMAIESNQLEPIPQGITTSNYPVVRIQT